MRTFDSLIAELRPLASELLQARDADLDLDLRFLKGVLCLLMWYAEDMSPDERAAYAEGYATSMRAAAEDREPVH